MRSVQGTHDQGRIAVGPIIAVLIVAAVGYGAYWLLGEYGFLGSDDQGPEHEAEADIETDDRPAWLHETDYEMPPLVRPGEDDIQPAYHRLADWLWDLVDESWSVEVLSVGEGDQYTWFSDYQGLYLISPTDDPFKLRELETTSAETVLHWDPVHLIAWAAREDRFDMAQVVEYDLRSGGATTAFAGNIFSSSNVVRGGVANMDFHSVLPDDSELWVTYTPSGFVTGVAFRDRSNNWSGSLATDQIRRMVQQSLGTDGGVDAWFDPAGQRAVYHGVYIDPSTSGLAEEMWVVHDFTTSSVDADAVVPTPRDDCVPVGAPGGGAFEGDRIVANCGGTEYLLDPYNMGEPVQR